MYLISVRTLNKTAGAISQRTREFIETKVKLVLPIFCIVLLLQETLPHTLFLSTSNGFSPMSGLRMQIHSKCE